MNTHYEIRTTRGVNAGIYDSEQRAKQERDRLALRNGTKWTVWRVERVEARVA